MKFRFLMLVTILLFLVGTSSAQTVLSINGGPYVSSYNTPFLYINGPSPVELSGTGNSISWIAGSENHEWACGNGNPSTGGLIVYTLNSVGQPCANSTSYKLSGTVTIGNCKGPARVDETFDDGTTFTGFYTYVGRHCQNQIVGGSFTLPGTQADGTCPEKECCPHGLPNCKPTVSFPTIAKIITPPSDRIECCYASTGCVCATGPNPFCSIGHYQCDPVKPMRDDWLAEKL